MMARETHPRYISNEKDGAKKNCYTSGCRAVFGPSRRAFMESCIPTGDNSFHYTCLEICCLVEFYGDYTWS